MAEKDVLSQEEIDALLESVEETSTEEVQTEASTPDDSEVTNAEFMPAESEEGQAVRTLNFANQERIVKGKLPVLNKVYDRAIRLFTSDLYHLTGKDFEIKQEPLTFVKHREFMGGLSNPSLMSIYHLKPLRGKSMILFDKIFVYDIVDYYFGGSSQFISQKDKEDFTATEKRIMEVVTTKLITALALAWEALIHLTPSKFPNEETNPQLVHIAEPEEMLLVSRFCLNFGKEEGSFSFVLPYSMLEPIKQQLDLGASRPDDEIDPNWIKSLRVELMDVELTIGALMAEAKSSLGQIMNWQVNEFIPLEMNDTVLLDIEGRPSFIATLGSSNDKRALKIIKKIGD